MHSNIQSGKWEKKISIDSSNLMNKILELIEAQKLFNIPNEKIDILIHPESLVHAIVELKNGLTKFIYHETSMIIPIANAIFDGKFEINDFKKPKCVKYTNIKDLTFRKVDKKIFQLFSSKKVNEHPSTSIIINATNEIFVDHFLQKDTFLSIYKIYDHLNDKNYKKYAIKTQKHKSNQYNRSMGKNKPLLKINKIRENFYLYH